MIATFIVDSVAFGPISATITDCNGCVTSASAFVGVSVFPGCTDPTAFNYNPQANVDDSSCVPFIYGCIDSLNLVSGLPNLNYDPLANTDDGSCTDTIMDVLMQMHQIIMRLQMLMMAHVYYHVLQE